MATVNILHYTHTKTTNGASPIIIRVIEKRKPYKRTLATVLPSQWDATKNRVIPKTHKNYAAINIRISNEYNRIEELILGGKFNLQRDFIDYFDHKKSGEDSVKKGLNLREIADLYLNTLIVKSGWTYSTFGFFINEFIGLLPDGIRLSEITEYHVSKWIAVLQDNNKESTIHTKVKVVRFVANFAVKYGYDTKPEALSNLKVSMGAKSFKIRLTESELEAFRNVILTHSSKLSEIRDMFLFAVYLRGVRISDIIMLKQSYIRDGRIIYRSEKTDKGFDIKLIPEAVEIVDKYKDEREYLFSFFNYRPSLLRTATENELEKVKQVKNITANINGKLRRIAEKAKINKKISTHIARHTFARMALDKIKDSNITMDLLGHTSMKVHEAYIREISQSDELDDAADKIFG